MENFEINKEEIKNNVCEWAFNNIGENFQFREYQLDTIVNILDNILNDKNHNQIIEAPTGSGKSLVNLISAGVLADYYNRESYILCSDLYLWKQYDDFISQHKQIKKKFGVLKGQTGNYVCKLNGEDMRNSDCRMAGVSWSSLFNPSSALNLGYSCAMRCEYIQQRKKAMKSKVVLMTYALYHFMINIVANPASPLVVSTPPFKKRDIIFCDECHNIPNIVSNNFSPTVITKHLDHLKILKKYANTVKNAASDLFAEGDESEDFGIVNEYTDDSLTEEFMSIFNIMSNDKATSTQDIDAIKKYIDLLKEFLPIVEHCESKLSYKKQIDKGSFTEDDKEFYKSCSWYRNMLCIWNDFGMAINETGPEYIIKNITEDRKDFHITVEFKCVKEDYICYKYLLSTAANRVMLSATIGGIDSFVENIGVKYTDEEADFTRIPSTFNFDKSPVHFLNRYKMSYANKTESFPKIQNMIYQMCEKYFDGVKGMIQTGSYANAKEIYANAPHKIQKRMLLYNTPKEKAEQITIHQMSKDSILIGPTLVEGIDLPNDQCRFIVIVKVPYPVITDKYVKRKIQLFPKWYNSVTSNTIIQGIGRGVRNENDYCETYILDACFLSLYNATKDQYPQELQERLKIYA